MNGVLIYIDGAKEDVASVVKSAGEFLVNQKKLNRKLVIFSAALAVYSYLSHKEIKEQAAKIYKLEKKIDELTYVLPNREDWPIED